MAKKIYPGHFIFWAKTKFIKDIEKDKDGQSLSLFIDSNDNKYYVITSSITIKYNYPNIFCIIHRTAGPAVTKDSIDEFWIENKSVSKELFLTLCK
jgi:hypothetical protein